MTTKRTHVPRPLDPRRLLAILTLLLPLACAVGLATGAVGISLTEVLAAVLGQSDGRTTTIVVDIRLPRVLLAAIMGANQ